MSLTCGTLESIRQFEQWAKTPVADAAIQLSILTPTPIATLPGGEIGKGMCGATVMASADSATNQDTFGTPPVWFRGTDDMCAMGAAMAAARQLSAAYASKTVLFTNAAAALANVVQTLAHEKTNPAVLIPCIFGPNMWSCLELCGITCWPLNSDAQGILPGEIVLATTDLIGRGYDVIGVIAQGGCCVPSGQIMSAGRRTALTQDANTANIPVIEDASGCYQLYSVAPDQEGQQYPSLCVNADEWITVGTTELLIAPSCSVAFATFGPTYCSDQIQFATRLAFYQNVKPTLLVQRATYLIILSLSQICLTISPTYLSLESLPNTTPPLPKCASTRAQCKQTAQGGCAPTGLCYQPADVFSKQTQIDIWNQFATVRWRFITMYMARNIDIALRTFALAKDAGVIDSATELSTPEGGVYVWLYLPCGVDSAKVSCNAIRPLNQKCGVLAWPGNCFTCCLTGEENTIVPGMPLNMTNQYCSCFDAVWGALGNAIAQTKCAAHPGLNACSACQFVSCVPPGSSKTLKTSRFIPKIPLC